MDSVFPRGLCSECNEPTKDRIPVVLAEVVGKVVYKLHGRWAPKLVVELLARSNEITGGVHLVSTFNLMSLGQ